MRCHAVEPQAAFRFAHSMYRICICSLRLARAVTKPAAPHERGTRAPSSVTRPWADGLAGICVLPARAGIAWVMYRRYVFRAPLLRNREAATPRHLEHNSDLSDPHSAHVATASVNTPPSADLGVAWECSRSRLGDYTSVRLLVRLQPFPQGQSWSMSNSRVRKYRRARIALRLQRKYLEWGKIGLGRYALDAWDRG
jgi:hypothetical protein